MKRTLSMVLGWVCLIGCSEAPAPTPEAQPAAAQPDVLVVVLDTVRPDMLSTYGYSRPTAPQLDAVAAAGESA